MGIASYPGEQIMNSNFILEKPLLFMVFNRPEKTKLVFAEIKKVRPKKLYISCDGPRDNFPQDEEKVKQVKELVSDQHLSWPCQIKRLYHETNLGVSMAGYKAFQWVFSQEEEMIELEDDCIPAQSFFLYCQELLDKYRDNDRICFITANNNSGVKSGDGTYFFSRYGGSWGWATWKRVWDELDYLMSDWPQIRSKKSFRKNFRNKEEYDFWKLQFQLDYEKLNSGKSKSYDIQTLYHIFLKDKFNIYPNYNLVTNIGWDDAASNTFQADSKFAGTPRVELSQIIHPEVIANCFEVDEQIFKYHFNFVPQKKYVFERYMIKKEIKRILRWESFLRPLIKK
jgi:hypothetical protein